MKLNCPVCSTNFIHSNSVWKYDLSELFQCNNCGIVYHVRDNNLYSNQVSTTYKAVSWGKFSKDTYDGNMSLPEVAKHTQRMENNLNYFSDFLDFSDEKNVLDIGAGIGLLEYIIEKTQSPLENSNITMIEPISENYQIIRQRYSSYRAINTHINQLENIEETYDIIFSQGVDYLFEDLNEAFKIIHGLLKEDATLLISRNVFIDTPCYFGGEPIIKAENLFAPNALINAYFLESHYRDFLQKNFEIIDSVQFNEEYIGENTVDGKHYNYVLKKKTDLYDASALNETKYLEQYNKQLKRLHKK